MSEMLLSKFGYSGRFLCTLHVRLHDHKPMMLIVYIGAQVSLTATGPDARPLKLLVVILLKQKGSLLAQQEILSISAY